MTPAAVFIPQRRCIACPACGKGEKIVEHLLADLKSPRDAGPWYCDACGVAFLLRAHPDGTITIELTGGREENTRVLLKLREREGPVYIEVKGLRFHPEDATSNHADMLRYLYEEHQCPTNFLRNAKEVWAPGAGGANSDPHGLFEVIEERPSPAGRDENSFTDEDVLKAVALDSDIARAILGPPAGSKPS